MLSINDVASLAEDTKAHIAHPLHLLGFLIFITKEALADTYLVLTSDLILVSDFMYA